VKLALLVVAFPCLWLAGCSADDNQAPADAGHPRDVNVADTSVPDSGNGFPPRPALGAMIDRMGRPLINTALNDAFSTDPTSQGTAKDAYNADNGVASWVGSYRGQLAQNLPLYDSLDGVCGNQLLCSAMAPWQTGAYDVLASALADDRLYTRTDANACSSYLALEANAVGMPANSDCGGRRPAYDVVDVTYSMLAAGQLIVLIDGGAGDAGDAGQADAGQADGGLLVGDGIGPDPIKTGGASFPYLHPPM